MLGAGHYDLLLMSISFFLGRILLVMFFSTLNLRAPSADRRETLPRDRKLGQFYNAGPKIRGGALAPKNWGPKTCTISVDFMQPHILIANISATAQDIQNRKAK